MARDNLVLQEDAWVVEHIIDTFSSFEFVIIERVVEGDPVLEGLARLLLKPLQLKTDRAEPLVLSSDPSHDYLERLGGRLIVRPVRQTRKRDLGPLLQVVQMHDLFGDAVGQFLLQVAATTLFLGLLQEQLVWAGCTARINLLGNSEGLLVLNRGVRRAEDDTVDAGFAEHYIGNDLALVYGLWVLGSVQLQVQDGKDDKVVH